MDGKTVSIIIPAYNCEGTIESCLSSVAGQSCGSSIELQVLVVDDGSTDGTAEICGRFAAEDSRFTYVKKQNGGVSSARNLGLRLAEGGFVAFLDADDEYEPLFIATLVDRMIFSQADLVECSFSQEFPGHREARNETRAVHVLSRDEAFCCFALEDRISPNVWSKIYRAELIGELRFDESMAIAEDRDFIFRYLQRCNKVVHVGTCLYRYRYVPSSAMHQGFRAELLDSVRFAEDFSAWGCRTYPEKSDVFLAQELRNKCRVLSLYMADAKRWDRLPDEVAAIKHRVRDIPVGVIRMLPPKHALLCAVVKFAPSVLPLLNRLSGRRG